MKNFRKSKNKGMTLIEMIVVSSIFIIVSTISIFNYNKFNSHISIQNLIEDMALSVRKVQGYAIGAKGIGGAFDYSYGISFSTAGVSPSGYPLPSQKSFSTFIDIDGNGLYTYVSSAFSEDYCGSPTSSNECLEFLNFKSNDKISKIEVYQGGSSPILLREGDSLHILFKRPNPEAIFCIQESGTSSCNALSNSISRATIYIQEDNNSEKPKQKSVTIWSTGQIYIN